MIETPMVTPTAEQLIAYIPLKATWADIQSVMHAGLDEMNSVLAAQGVTATGPWFTHHFRRPIESFEYEMCFPVAGPIQPARRVKNGKVPVMKVARTVYHGGYEKLGEGWGEFCEWLSKSGLETREDLYEAYLVDSSAGDDSSKYRTELSVPLKG